MFFSPSLSRRLRCSTLYTFFSVFLSIGFFITGLHAENLLEKAFKAEQDAQALTSALREQRFAARGVANTKATRAVSRADYATARRYRTFGFSGLYTCLLAIAWAVAVSAFTIEQDILLFFRLVAGWHVLLLVLFGVYLLGLPFSFQVAAGIVLVSMVGGLGWVSYQTFWT